MRRIRVVFYLLSCVLLLPFFALVTPAFANNPPDSGHSSLSAANQAPADGSSTISVTVTLQDSSGNPLSGDSVTFSDSSNSNAVLNPSSTTLDSSGQATFTISSTIAQTDNISVTDNSSSTSLNNLGQVTFTSPTTPTPTPDTSCTDSPPGTPQLTSAVTNGSGQITLTWTDAPDPVSYYLVSYGNSSGQYIYGNPNVGGQGTTSYTVGNLADGTTYYFVVKAVNGCTPGSFSNEVSATTTGGVAPTTTTVSPTDTPDTSSQTTDDTPTDIPTDTPMPTVTAIPTLAPTSVAGISIVKTGVSVVLVIIILGAIGAYIYWRKRKRRPTVVRSESETVPPSETLPPQD